MTHAIDAHIARRLRARREERDLSQTTLGKAVGVTFQQIQKYENGSNRVAAAMLYQFARFLEVDVGWFFRGIPASACRESARGTRGRT